MIIASTCNYELFDMQNIFYAKYDDLFELEILFFNMVWEVI